MNINNFTVLYDNIIITPHKKEEEIQGLILPSMSEEKPQLGTVVAIGDGRLMDDGTVVPLKIMVGDTVLFNKYSTTQFFLENVEYLILREEDVIGLIRKQF